MNNIFIAVFPLIFGFLLDCIIGDPYTMPHPIRLIGKLISVLEKKIRKNFGDNLRTGGIFLALAVISVSVVVPLLILVLCYNINIYLGTVSEGILCFYMTAGKCLKDESMKVYRAISEDDTEKARKAVSMIVGRDTDVLDRKGIIKAAVETVAENTSDGVTAPLMYMALGGAAGGFFYKAVNTMDSMIGYRNEKYEQLGKFSAKLDDVLNYIPSRLTALAMIFSAYILKFDGANAYRIWKRDRRKHASPNSAQTESVCAGALNVQLAGDAYYFGELHKKEYIGDNIREIENEDIKRANMLMYTSSLTVLLFCIVFRIIVWGVIIL